jgi:hypothetical protein
MIQNMEKLKELFEEYHLTSGPVVYELFNAVFKHLDFIKVPPSIFNRYCFLIRTDEELVCLPFENRDEPDVIDPNGKKTTKIFLDVENMDVFCPASRMDFLGTLEQFQKVVSWIIQYGQIV